MSAIFRITDGTTTINLLSTGLDGFFLKEYAPVLSGYKGGGEYQDSPLADNRRLVFTRRETVNQPIVLNVKAVSDDRMAAMLQELKQLLIKAESYWKADWQNEPVWLEAKTPRETYTRYALVYSHRIEDYPAPYQQPFLQANCTPVAEEMTLFLELGQWLDVSPNTDGGQNLSVTGGKYYPTTNTLRFDTQTDTLVYDGITVSDNAAIQDLPPSGFTYERWARFPLRSSVDYNAFSIDKGNSIRIRENHNSSSGIGISATFDNSPGLDARADATYAATAAAFDGDWHHVAITFDGASAPQIWLDGVEVSAYFLQAAPGGSYVSDVGSDLVFLPDLGGFGWGVYQQIEFGWIRISDTDRYSTSFTPDDLCSPPVIDANTVIQFNLAEGAGLTLDNAEGTAALDGTVTDFPSEWSITDDCMTTEAEATTSEVFVANKFCLQEITNIHITNTGSNLIGGSWPADVFSGTDDTYIGSTDGLFNNVVLNIDTTASATPTWEYWDGSTWSTLSTSNSLTLEGLLAQTGQVIVSWKPPSDWATTSTGTLPTGYWIRQTANIGTIQHEGGADPYTVTWPFVQVEADQIPGDIPALARTLLRPVGSDGTNSAAGAADQIIYGSRSLSRGGSFRPFINMSSTGNVAGIYIIEAGATLTASNDAPTGEVMALTATTAFAPVGQAYINGTISRDYSGRFRLFARFSYDINTANTMTLIARVQYGYLGSYFDARPVVIDDTYEGSTPLTNPHLQEFSNLHIRADLLAGTTSEVGELIITLYVKTDTGTSTIYLHDFVLMPIDEFYGEVQRTDESEQQATALSYIELDGTNQKLYNRAVRRKVDTGRIQELWVSKGSYPPALQSGTQQRVFFLQRSSAASNPQQSVSWQTLGVRLSKVSRYLGFRGDQ